MPEQPNRKPRLASGTFEVYALFAGALLVFLITPLFVRHARDELINIEIGVFFAFAAWMIFRGTRKVVAARRAADRFVTGRCINCGYDLRGSGETCPECGTVKQSISPETAKNSMQPVAYVITLAVVACCAAFAIMIHTAARFSGH